MALTFIPVTGTVGTTSGSTAFVDLATYTIPSDCSFLISDIFVIGKGPSGETATAKAEHRGKQVSGTASLVGNIVNIVTFNTGSDTALAATSSIQMTITGSILSLQVKTTAALNVTWYGGFTVIKF